MRGGLSAAPAFTSDADVFDRWLNGPAGAPVAVALSGGGDSLALLHLAKAWAERAGRQLIALTVDHGLQPASAAWSRFAADRAARLGVPHRTLVWAGEKPASGLPAAARAVRHALLAEATRAASARVLLMGHTADDILEAEQMRRMGASTPSPRVWSPSPAWPQGRGVFLFRPLLTHRRADLRALLRDLGEVWIDDPTNDDPRYARTAARRGLSTCGAAAPADIEPPRLWPGLAQVETGPAGDLTLRRDGLLALDRATARRGLGALLLCAAGGTRTPAARALDRLLDRLAAPGDIVATLAGARLEARGAGVMACREVGEHRRRGLAAASLPLGESVFDGRFLITASEPGWRIAPLRGFASRLPAPQRAWLRRLPAAARAALPATISPAGDVGCPILEGASPAAVALIGQRLRATLGAFVDEASLWRVANLPAAS